MTTLEANVVVLFFFILNPRTLLFSLLNEQVNMKLCLNGWALESAQ